MSTASSTRLPVLVLVGPTASGKTALLEALFAADAPRSKRLPPAVVVSADSMQAYRGMDIGTAKPGPGLLARLPHRLIDILDPSDQYTAGDFVRRADEACAEISAAGALPVVCGGTGFYVRNFVFGLPSAPASDPGTREKVASDLERLGAEALRSELSATDPASARRIAPRDLYRLTRALEVVRATGRPLSDFRAPAEPRDRYDFLVAAVDPSREELYRRIEARVEAMFAAGLADEVARLAAAGYGRESPGMRAIGYREFFAGGRDPASLSASALAEVEAEIKLDSRRYAKRQLTFFRCLPGLRRVAPEPEALAALVEELLAREGGRGA